MTKRISTNRGGKVTGYRPCPGQEKGPKGSCHVAQETRCRWVVDCQARELAELAEVLLGDHRVRVEGEADEQQCFDLAGPVRCQRGGEHPARRVSHEDRGVFGERFQRPEVTGGL